MTHSEYIDLFHKTQANLVAFQPLLQCDEAVMKMIEVAVAAEREACAEACEAVEVPDVIYGAHPDYLEGKLMAISQAAAAIRARGQHE